MADFKLSAKPRTEFGKGASRRNRRDGLVPAVIYGGEVSGVHVLLDNHEVFLIVKDVKNALVEVNVEGGDKHLALIKEVQVHPVRREIQHVDLLAIHAGEKVDVEVPVVIVGESAPGTIHAVEEFTLKVQALATSIPEHIEINIEGMEDGTVVRISDVVFPEGVECDLDPELDVVTISVPRAEVEAAEGEEGEAAEGEASAE